jgi:hypothetical protein
MFGSGGNRGRESQLASASPPSEPYGRISRIRLSGRFRWVSGVFLLSSDQFRSVPGSNFAQNSPKFPLAPAAAYSG